MAIKAVISDFGGVLTSPLLGSFMALQDEIGIAPGTLGRAMQRIAERESEHPLFEIERGRISEADFLETLTSELEPELGHRPELHRFSEIYFDALEVNEPMLGLMRDVRDRGLQAARQGVSHTNRQSSEWERCVSGAIRPHDGGDPPTEGGAETRRRPCRPKNFRPRKP